MKGKSNVYNIRSRKLTVCGSDLANIHALRSADDAAVIAGKVANKDVVILGSSFIGMEVAAYCSSRARSVTVVGNTAVPFQNTLGLDVGKMLQKMFEAHRVQFCSNAVLKGFSDRNGELSAVLLEGGTELPADVCVLGVGVYPATDFLAGVVDLDSRGYIVVDEHMRTSTRDILAAGDVVNFPLAIGEFSARASIGHWQLAHHLGHVAGCVATDSGNGQETLAAVDTVPFFWSQMFGRSLRYAGYCPKFDDVIISVQPAREGAKIAPFAAYYCVENTVRSIATMNRDPLAAEWAEKLRCDGFASKEEILRQIAEQETPTDA